MVAAQSESAYSTAATAVASPTSAERQPAALCPSKHQERRRESVGREKTLSNKIVVGWSWLEDQNAAQPPPFHEKNSGTFIHSTGVITSYVNARAVYLPSTSSTARSRAARSSCFGGPHSCIHTQFGSFQTKAERFARVLLHPLERRPNRCATKQRRNRSEMRHNISLYSARKPT